MRIWSVSLATLLAGMMACGGEAPPEEEELIDGKFEAWNTANNPAFVDNTFSYEVASLPLSGEAKQTPWSGDYWATAKDSLNVRWDGAESLSPAEKVEQGLGVKDFPQWITENVGIYAHNGRTCDESSECADLKDGSSCVKPRGATGEKAGRCIQGWWGICHGWAPAAIAEPQPVKPVEKNGITFYPGDLEGLASFAYQKGLKTKFLSERCNKKASDLEPDDSGRIIDGECRDMNPGSMFVVLTNMLGLRGVGLVEDKTWDWQVWNQPVRGYRVTNPDAAGQVPEITKEEAIALLGGQGSDYTYNAEAKRFFSVEMDVNYIVESRPARTPNNPDDFTRTDHYAFVLEADDAGRVVGGEWVGASRTKHPDFMWWPVARPSSNQGGLTYDKVKELIDLASENGGGEPAETQVLFQDLALSGNGTRYAKRKAIGVKGGRRLEVKMTGTGKADLYVTLGLPFTILAVCKSTSAGAEESCTVTAPPIVGATYWAIVVPKGGDSKVTVTASVSQ